MQQCHRVSPGPDFVLVVQVRRHGGVPRAGERLFTQDANVRNVKAFFSVRRAKFETRIALPRRAGQRLRTTRPFRYSPSGKVDRHRVVAAPRRARAWMKPSTPASMPAPATILWNRSAPMPPEHENVNSAPPGAQQHEREAVDVLVGARRALGVGGGRRELRRVEHDRVEAAAAASSSVAQRLVDVGVERLVARRVEAVAARRVPSARASAGADESTLVTCAAPPASAATLKPPV